MELLSITFSILLAGVPGGSCLPDPQQLWKLAADDPKLLAVLTRHGIQCRAQGQYASAETLLERVVFLLENSKATGHAIDDRQEEATALAGPLSNLASVYRDQGRRSEAERMLQRAYRLAAAGDPETRAYVDNNLALAYWDRGDVARAEPLLRRAAAAMTGAGRLPVLANLGTLYRSTGRLAAAEEVTRQVLQADERSWQAWRNLAAIHRLRKDLARSEDALLRALELAGEGPHKAETLFEKTLLAMTQRDWVHAGDAIQAAISEEEKLFGEESVNLIPYVELQVQVLRELKEKARAKEAALRARLLRAAL